MDANGTLMREEKVYSAEGYEFSKGAYSVSNSPGLGLSVRPEVYREKCAASETVIS